MLPCAAVFQDAVHAVVHGAVPGHDLGQVAVAVHGRLPGVARAAEVAAVFHQINHAVFKASLFMAAGIVDHEADGQGHEREPHRPRQEGHQEGHHQVEGRLQGRLARPGVGGLHERLRQHHEERAELQLLPVARRGAAGRPARRRPPRPAPGRRGGWPRPR